MALVAATIRGGTNCRGAPPDIFDMQRYFSIRYDLPSTRLRPFISAYVVHASTSNKPASEWFLPTDAIVRLRLEGSTTTFRTLEGRFDPPPASLVGPTSRAYLATICRGVHVSIGIRPLGWMALTELSANRFRDRAVDLREVTSGDFVTRLMGRLRRIEDEFSLAPALDDALEPLLCHGEEPAFDVGAIHGALCIGKEIGIAEVAAGLDMSGRSLLTASNRAFGLTPKLLFRRERFLQVFREMLMAGDGAIGVAARSRYFDTSHFLRDATDFLGTTPRRFIGLGTTLQRATLFAEQAVLTRDAIAT